ncbi:hypothetical protein N303_12024, partial [Cuculus canorus]
VVAAVEPAEKKRIPKAPQAKGPAGGDGNSLRTEGAAHSGGGGGSHSGVLWEGGEDGSRQGHHHGRRLDGIRGVLALPDAGLVAAIGQRSWVT